MISYVTRGFDCCIRRITRLGRIVTVSVKKQVERLPRRSRDRRTVENFSASLCRETESGIECRPNDEEGTKKKTAVGGCRSAASTNSSLNKMANPIVVAHRSIPGLCDTRRSRPTKFCLSCLTLARRIKARIDLKDSFVSCFEYRKQNRIFSSASPRDEPLNRYACKTFLLLLR